MDEAEARLQIEALVSASSDPVLTTDEVTRLVDLARRVDAEGRAPSDEDWSPTWDLNAAAVAGWTMKAGNAAGRFDFHTDGQIFRRGQIIDHCRAMAAEYRRKVTASAPTESE